MKRIAAWALMILCPIFLSGCIFDTILGDFVNSAPRAVIDAAPSDGEAPLDVTFDGHYSHDDDGAIAEYHWDFGDSNDRTPDRMDSCTHTYSHAGTYLATLTVVDDEGATNSQQIAIVVSNPAPVAEFLISNDSPLPGSEVQFNATGSHDPDGEITSYEWDFGDSATATGVTASHTYSEGGYYVVTLTLTDDEGATGYARVGINVLPGQSKCADDTTCEGGDPDPYAVIQAWPNPFGCSGVNAGTAITFDGVSSRAGVGEIVSYLWEFGDGDTASGQSVTHTYEYQGNYKVELTIVDSGGGVDAASGTAQINSTCSSGGGCN